MNLTIKREMSVGLFVCYFPRRLWTDQHQTWQDILNLMMAGNATFPSVCAGESQAGNPIVVENMSSIQNMRPRLWIMPDSEENQGRCCGGKFTISMVMWSPSWPPSIGSPSWLEVVHLYIAHCTEKVSSWIVRNIWIKCPSRWNMTKLLWFA